MKICRYAQLASDCDIELKNLQYYFPTKEDLLIGVIQESFDQALDSMARAEREVPEIEPLLFDWWDVRAFGVWAQFYSMAANSRKLMAVKEDIFARFYEMVTDLLQRQYPDVSRDRTLSTARIITALIDGAILARTAEPPQVARLPSPGNRHPPD